VAISQDSSASGHPDALAAVALHTLVTEGREGMTREQVALACERDQANHYELGETEAALRLLLEDDLAERADEIFKPTRAAIRAFELSF
jgi:hypothetical protein